MVAMRVRMMVGWMDVRKAVMKVQLRVDLMAAMKVEMMAEMRDQLTGVQMDGSMVVTKAQLKVGLRVG